ncbi:MAG: protein kinase [Synergistaceae bacterium]|nr:protein kinase [Synergistaceae bacterium]
MAENVAAFPCPHCGWRHAKQGSAHLLRPGTILRERYYIGRVLGQGGFGITYLGWDDVLNVKAAIKEYFPMGLVTRNPDTMQVGYAGDGGQEEFERGRQKFLEEARILASFAYSPNIVSTKDFFREGPLAYMVMEYLEGADLKKYLDERGGIIPWGNAQAVIMHVIDALKDVHAQGLLHRDVSPDNIFITSRGQIKILDFGSARFAAGRQNKSLSVVLKPGYAPVEQYQTHGRQGPWTDVYSLGATLYRCVTGKLPPESLSRIEQDDIKTPSMSGVSVPPAFEKALMKALSVKANDRFQSVQDFQAALLGRALEASPSGQAGQIAAPGASFQVTRKYDEAAAAAFKPNALSRAPKLDRRLKPILIGIPLCAVVALALYMLLFAESPERASPDIGSQIQQAQSSGPAEALPAARTEAPQGAPEELFKEAEGLIRSARASDVKKAVGLYERAADLGHVEAMAALGSIYEIGDAVKKNLTLAAGWYEKAADSGYEEIKFHLAQIYAYGDAAEGLPADYGKALDLLNSIQDGSSGQVKMLKNFVETRLRN